MPNKKYHHGSHSKYLLKYHFVFCCKYRKKCFNGPEVTERIKALFTEIAAKAGFAIDVMEVDPTMPDHIHVLVDEWINFNI